MAKTYLPLVFLLGLSCSLTAQTTYYVDGNATNGSADGTSWANAFLQLQQALAIAQDGDEIWVAKGIYKPTAGTDRFAHFNLPSGVTLFGGFAGSESLREQRNWQTNPTTLSGDIGVPGDSTDNSFNVLYSYSPNEKTRLDGFIIEEGNANNSDINVDFHRPTRSGGGLYLDGENFGYAQLSVANCVFRHNRALNHGGGLYANGREGGMAIVRLENCLFEQNTSKTFGGGLSLENYFEQPFSLEIKGCEFRNNFAFSDGAAVWLRANQTVSFSDCSFHHNTSPLGITVHFEGVPIHYPFEFVRCEFQGNSNYSIFYYGQHSAVNDFNARFHDCVFRNNGLPLVNIYFSSQTKSTLRFSNCIFQGNASPPGSSGGLIIGNTSNGSGSSALFANCLFYKGGTGGILSSSQITTHFINSIVIENPNGTSKFFRGEGTYKVSNSLFSAAGCTELGTNQTPVFCESGNLFGLDPLFVNPLTDDFRLQACSPAINAGTNAILDSLGISTDLEGNPRVRNGIVDMGPYEAFVSLRPVATAEPGCAGANDGAIGFDPNICPPYTFEWDNGHTTGTNTDGLSAGTYVFSAIGANNIPVFDTITLFGPDTLKVKLTTQDVSCFGQASGQIETMVNGGTPPYQYFWQPALPPVPDHYNLPAGNYALTVVDAHDCSHNVQSTIESAAEMQFFITVQNPGCMGCANGSIVFDSIVGGFFPPLPQPMYNLPAGHYCVTITDLAGCTAVSCVTLSPGTDVAETHLADVIQFGPNPTVADGMAWLKWLGGASATLQVYAPDGAILHETTLHHGQKAALQARWSAGLYPVVIRSSSGERYVFKWVID